VGIELSGPVWKDRLPLGEAVEKESEEGGCFPVPENYDP